MTAERDYIVLFQREPGCRWEQVGSRLCKAESAAKAVRNVVGACGTTGLGQHVALPWEPLVRFSTEIKIVEVYR